MSAAAFIAAVFLVSDARRFDAPDLEGYFRRRSALAAGYLLVVDGASAWSWCTRTPRTCIDGLTSGWGLAFRLLVGRRRLLATDLLVSRDNRRGTRLTAIARSRRWCSRGAWLSARTRCPRR